MLAALALPAGASAQRNAWQANHARVRLEVWGGDTFTGRGQWLHDAYFAHAVELEWLLLSHLSMGLRAIPVLVYLDAPVIAGSALGFTHRLYWEPSAWGLYVGPQLAILAHHRTFDGNSAYVNIMSSLEVGYQLHEPSLRIGVKLEHVSNANLARDNRGWNGLALILGVVPWTSRTHE